MRPLLIKMAVWLAGLWLFNLAAFFALGILDHDLERAGYAFDRYRWQEFYRLPAGDTLDILFLGSSHTYRGFDPRLIDSLLDTRSFNLGSSGQTPATSFFVLRNALAHLPVRTVVVELYFHTFLEREQLRNGAANYLEMKPSPARRAFFREGFDRYDQLALTALPILRRKHQVGYLLKRLWFGRPTLAPAGRYAGQGYVERVDTIDLAGLTAPNFYDHFTFRQADLVPRHLAALKALVDLCRENGIRIAFVVAPMPRLSIDKIGNPGAIRSWFREQSETLGIPGLDHWYPEPLGLVDTIHFFDDNHLNQAGVVRWNAQLAEWLSALPGKEE